MKLRADDQSERGGWKSGMIKECSKVPQPVASNTRLKASSRSAFAMSLAGHAQLKGLWKPSVLILPAVARPIMCLPDKFREDRCRCLGRTTADTKRFQKQASAEINMLSLKMAFEIIVMTEGFNGVAWTGTCDPGASTLRLTR